MKQEKLFNFIEQEFDLNLLHLNEKRTLKNILRALSEFLHVSQDITMKSHAIFKDLTNKNQLALIEFVNLINYLKDWYDRIQRIFYEHTNAMRWASYLPEELEDTFQMHYLSWGKENSFIDYLAVHSKVIFTSSTLSYRDTENYFSEQLKNLPMQVIPL